MKEKKITLDRKKITSFEISQRQDFEKILFAQQTHEINRSLKNSWFWGVTGMATLTLPILFTTLVDNENSRDYNNIQEHSN